MPQQYYLEIPGLHGSSVDQGYVGAFAVTSFSFAADEPVFPTSGGLGVGKPTFGPLQVTVADATGLADLMRGLAKGSMLPGASLIGVDNPGLHTVETYRVNLANVTVSSIEQTQDNGYVVTLNYGTIGVITHDLRPDGTAINPPATFGFDVITNVTVAAPPNVTPGSGAGPIAPTKFFLLINGVNGGSQDAAHQGWFEINSFDFAAANNGSASAAKLGVDPLSLSLSSEGLTALLAKLSTGFHITGARIEGMSSAGSQGSQAVYDLNLSNVVVSHIGQDDAGGTSLGLTFGAFQLSTTSVAPDGRLVAPTTISWDLTTNSPLTDPLPTIAPGPSSGGGVGHPTQYYLEIPGLHGSSQAQGYVGAFGVTSFNFAADEPVFMASGVGLGAGKPTFGPLQVTVADATGLTDLMRDLAKGSMLPGASLIGVDNSALHMVETYRVNLANVTVSSIEQTQDHGYVVTLDYGTIGVITHDLRPDGTAVNPPATFGFDVLTNVTAAAPPNVTPGSGAGAIAPTKFFLLINGVNGGSQDAAHQGWFELNSFDFAAANNGTASAPRLGVDPLSLSLPTSEGLTALLAKLSTGAHITGARIEGMSSAGSQGPQAVYDLNLSNVVVSHIGQDDAGGTSLGLTFGAFQLSTASVAPDGALAAPTTISWDRTTNAPLIDPLPTIAPGSTSGGAASHPTQYYLEIPGLHGSSQAQGYVGAFGVTSFSFTADEAASAGIGGLGTGKPTFGPLQVTVADATGLTDLMRDLAKGSTLPGVSLIGVDNSGLQTVETYRVNLANVTVSSIKETQDHGYVVTLDYGTIGVITHDLRPDGTAVNPPATFGFDVLTNVTAAAPPNVTPGSGAGAIAPTKFFLLINGVNGGSQDAAHQGWFELNSFDFAANHIVGKLGVDALSLSLSSEGLTALLAKLSTGAHITGARIEGMSSAQSAQGPQAVYDLDLSNVVVSHIGQDDTGHTSLGLTYAAFQLSTASVAPDGALAAPTTLSWDLLKNSPLTDPLPTISPGSSSGGGTPPAAPAGLSLDATADSGVHGDKLTNDNTLVIAGSAPAGATVKLREGSVVIGSSVADSTGHFSITTSALPDGAHVLTATATDSTGLVSATSSSLTITVDTIAPGAPNGLGLDARSDSGAADHSLTQATTPQIDGHAEAGSTVNLYDGLTLVGTGQADASGAFRITTSALSEGSHALTATATDAAGNVGTASTALNIVIDQPPALAADTVGGEAVSETAGLTGSAALDTATTTLTFTDIDLNDTHTVAVGTPSITGPSSLTLPGNLAANLASALSTSIATDSTSTGSGSVAASFSAPDSTFDFLAQGETLTLTYNVTVTDNHGLASSQPVTITVTGTNDAPVLSADAVSHAIVESPVAGLSTPDTATTTLNFTDVDLSDTHTVAVAAPTIVGPSGLTLPSGLAASLASALGATITTDSIGAGSGSVAASFSAPDSTFDFLAQGETLTLTYNVTVTDNHGLASTQPVTITVAGTNDAPILSADAATSHALNEGSVVGSSAADTATSTLVFTDLDLSDHHTATVAAPTLVWTGGSTLPGNLAATLASALSTSIATDSTGTGSGSVAASFSAPDSTFDFLAQGETLTITYNVTITDNHGLASTQPVTIVVTGTNDAPVLSADAVASHAFSESSIAGSSAADTATSTLLFTDVDLNDHHTATVAAPTLAWTGGTTLPSGLSTALAHALTTQVTDSAGAGAGSVAASFSAPDSTFDFLAQGETLTVTYKVTVTDDHGLSSTQPVTITVTGTNDAPVLSADSASSHAITEGPSTGSTAADTATTTLTFADVDLSDTHTVAVAAPTITGPSGLTLPGNLAANLASALSTSIATDSTSTGSGSVAASFSAPDSTFDFLAQGETLTLTYKVTVTDNHGLASTQPVTITVTGTNDAPALVADAGPHAIAEAAGVAGSATADATTATLSFTDVDLSDAHTVAVAAPTITGPSGLALPSALSTVLANALTTQVTDSTGTGSGAVAASFTAPDSTFDFLAQGETLTVTYKVTITDNHGLTSTQPVTIAVTGTNDAPVLSADAASGHAITEGPAPGSAAADTATTTLTFTDLDLSDHHTATVAAPTLVWSGGTTLPAGLAASVATALTTQMTDSTGTAAGSVAASFSAPDSTFDFLAQGETLTLTYKVTVTDDHGLASTQPVTITVTGTNDAPVLSADAVTSHALTEGPLTGSSAADTATSTLLFADLDLNDHHTATVTAPTLVWTGGTTLPSGLSAALANALTTQVADSTGTGAGSVAANFAVPDSTFDFLAQGETLTVTYNVTVTDSHGLASTQPVTIVVTGTNDAPVLVADAGPHAITEAAGVTGSAAAEATTATLSFADLDLNDHHTATVAAPTLVWSGGTTLPAGLSASVATALTTQMTDSTGTAAGSVAASFSAPDSTFDFLAQGETLTLTYKVTVTDNHGLASSQPVTITVTGTNDAPVLSADAVTNHALTEGAAAGPATPDTATATLAFTDLDLNDHHTATVAAPTLLWTGGASLPSGLAASLATALTTQMTDSSGVGAGSVTASFTAPDSAFDFLAQGETLSVTYKVTVTDNHGLVSTQPVTIVVTGTNDAPVLSADSVASHAITEGPLTGSSAADTATSTLLFADLDLNDHHTATVTAPTLVWTGGTTLPSGLSTALANALTTQVTDSAGTGAGSVAANFSAPDSTFDFLAQGETLTVTYKVTVTDSHGLASTQPVTIVVTGSNDAPVIVSGSGVSGSIAELPNGAGLAAIDQTSGVVKFHDPDLNDRPTASLTAQSVTGHLGSGAAFTLTAAQVSALDAAFQFAPAAGNTDDGSLNWTYRAQDASLDFLGAGESVTVVSTLKVDDHHGGVVSQDITVTVTGANDAPTLLPDQNGVRQHSTLVVDKAHGVLSNDTDPDTHDLLQVVAVNGSAAGVGHAINGQYGALTLNADGSYTYVAKSGDGQFAEDVFTYTAADGHGGTTTETLNLSVFNSGSYIQGSAANPIITAGNGPTVLAAGVGNETLTAGNGPDVFLAGWGKDVMNAGHGPDTFEFDHNGFGSVTINNFEPGHDTLAFRASAFSNLTALPQMVQVGQDVVITVDAHDTIILHGVAMNSLRASDFSFI